MSYRPAELRAHIEHVSDKRHEIQMRGVAWDRPGGTRFLDVAFAPLLGDGGTLLGTRIAYTDTTTSRRSRTIW